MNYGTAVITSNISSLPEVGGDAALYVNPNDTNDIALKIKKLLDDEGLRRELIAKGKKQVESFSWEKSAKETLKVLEEVANG
jgi:glycosyltransferase involved in cell wall biosynthesis